MIFMATETTENTYTGVHGILTVGDSNPFAHVTANISIPRDVVSLPRGGKWSDISLPGKLKPSIKITYGLVDSDLLIDALDDGTNTSSTSDEQLLAATAGDGTIQPVEAGLSNPSVPMTIKLKIISTDGYSAGWVTISGTDANNELVSETIGFPTVATGSTTNYFYGHQMFKTINLVTLPAVLASNDTVTVYGMGQRSITIGSPLKFTFVGKLARSATQYVQLTATNCWLKDFVMTFGSASDPVIPEQELVVTDPDSDITLVVNST